MAVNGGQAIVVGLWTVASGVFPSKRKKSRGGERMCP